MTETKQKLVKKTRKKKKTRKLTPFVKLICFILIGVSAFLLFEVAREIYTTVELRRQLAEAEEKYQEVKDENAYLTTEREKLTDPEYVQSYARGNYMLSKDGEQIFYLPEKED
ncbi:MAG: septum formation initiator family protein [Solobacterium sp.]|nr:septum formation initiator family protein [Solobacterium sp.]